MPNSTQLEGTSRLWCNWKCVGGGGRVEGVEWGGSEEEEEAPAVAEAAEGEGKEEVEEWLDEVEAFVGSEVVVDECRRDSGSAVSVQFASAPLRDGVVIFGVIKVVSSSKNTPSDSFLRPATTIRDRSPADVSEIISILLLSSGIWLSLTCVEESGKWEIKERKTTNEIMRRENVTKRMRHAMYKLSSLFLFS